MTFPVNNSVFVKMLFCFTEECVRSINSFKITRKYNVYQVWGGEEKEKEQVKKTEPSPGGEETSYASEYPHPIIVLFVCVILW